MRAEKILDASHWRAARLAQDPGEIRALRCRLAEPLRSAAETHLALLETLELDPEQGGLVHGLEEGTVALLQTEPRPAAEGKAPSEYVGDSTPV